MKVNSINWFIFSVFVHSRLSSGDFIPCEQGMLLFRINERRKQIGYEPINNDTLCNHLSKLKSQGKVVKLRWFVPSTGNIWIWVKD